MPKRDEVGVLRKSVDHRQDDRLVVDAWETLHKIHGDVTPHRGWDVQRLKESNGVKLYCFVLLPRVTGAHELGHQGARA
jgi:hypothetical protein